MEGCNQKNPGKKYIDTEILGTYQPKDSTAYSIFSGPLEKHWGWDLLPGLRCTYIQSGRAAYRRPPGSFWSLMTLNFFSGLWISCSNSLLLGNWAALYVHWHVQPVVTYRVKQTVGCYDGLKLYIALQMNYRNRVLANPWVTENRILKNGAVFCYATKLSTMYEVKQRVLTWQHEKPFMSSGNSLRDSTENVRKQELQGCYLMVRRTDPSDPQCILVFRVVFDISLTLRTWLLLGISNVFCFPDNQHLFQCSWYSLQCTGGIMKTTIQIGFIL